MTAPEAARAARVDNRRARLLDAAATLFSQRGFHATSMRDIGAAVGMLSGSIYYHFASKEELFLAVCEVGKQAVAEAVDAAVADQRQPWPRLQAACAAHLRSLITHRAYTQVMIRTLPQEVGALETPLLEMRRDYEARFRRLIEELALPAGTDRHFLRLLLFGALNWSPVWYRRGGDSPETVARSFVEMLRKQLDPGYPPD